MFLPTLGCKVNITKSDTAVYIYIYTPPPLFFTICIDAGTGQCGLTCGFKNWSTANVLNILAKPQRHKAMHCTQCASELLSLPKECESKYYSNYNMTECRLNDNHAKNRDILKSYWSDLRLWWSLFMQPNELSMNSFEWWKRFLSLMGGFSFLRTTTIDERRGQITKISVEILNTELHEFTWWESVADFVSLPGFLSRG